MADKWACVQNAWRADGDDVSVCVRVRVPLDSLSDDPVVKGARADADRYSARSKALCTVCFVCVLSLTAVLRIILS